MTACMFYFFNLKIRELRKECLSYFSWRQKVILEALNTNYWPIVYKRRSSSIRFYNHVCFFKFGKQNVHTDVLCLKDKTAFVCYNVTLVKISVDNEKQKPLWSFFRWPNLNFKLSELNNASARNWAFVAIRKS